MDFAALDHRPLFAIVLRDLAVTGPAAGASLAMLDLPLTFVIDMGGPADATGHAVARRVEGIRSLLPALADAGMEVVVPPRGLGSAARGGQKSVGTPPRLPQTETSGSSICATCSAIGTTASGSLSCAWSAGRPIGCHVRFLKISRAEKCAL